jgi:hypothetical protein
MGVKDVKWVESYLTERKQLVNVNVNLNSYILPVKYPREAF